MSNSPLEKDTRKTLQTLAEVIDIATGPRYGFVLLVFSYNDKDGTANCVTSAELEDLPQALRKQADAIERGEML